LFYHKNSPQWVNFTIPTRPADILGRVIRPVHQGFSIKSTIVLEQWRDGKGKGDQSPFPFIQEKDSSLSLFSHQGFQVFGEAEIFFQKYLGRFDRRIPVIKFGTQCLDFHPFVLGDFTVDHCH